MPYTEDNLLPLSGLQHLKFCERRCALIHIEQVWNENRLTAEGRIMHERVHAQGIASRGAVRTESGIRLRSLQLGLYGQADVVEFHKEDRNWRPFPIEFKRGKPKSDACYEVQLCAQGMCLEEMTGNSVPCGALFYGKTRRRKAVDFDEALRREVKRLAARFHELIDAALVPDALATAACRSCSLREACAPDTPAGGRATDFVRKEIMMAMEEDDTK